MTTSAGAGPAGAERRIRLARDVETCLREERGGEFRFRYAYARSADSRDSGAGGQDFLLLRHDDHRFVFALCDGVSESFQGEIAAEGVGSVLVDWLWSIPPSATNPTALRADLTACLRQLADEVTRRVAAYPIPSNVPTLLREVLDLRRAEGSETMLVGARLDGPGHASALGRVVLAWLGDSRLRLWGPTDERTWELGDAFHTTQRWSSRRGPIHAEPRVTVFPLTDGRRYLLRRLAAYSDGLAELDRLATLPPSPALQRLIDRTGLSPASDDVSLIEVWFDDASGDG